MSNPYLMTWDNPTTNTDGTVLPQTDIAGYQIGVDSAPAVSVPIGFATSFDLTTLAGFSGLKSGQHTASLAVVNKEGTVGVAATTTFPVLAVPATVTNLAVGK
jgi:hypothetical protein